jgi:hypothetical protein
MLLVFSPGGKKKGVREVTGKLEFRSSKPAEATAGPRLFKSPVSAEQTH